MGWLDKLLGREEKTTPEAPAAPEAPVESPPSEVAQAEDRAAEARDDALANENRVPPGTG
ncbi:MAG: hypothetical protein ACRDNI_01505 [Gaiellaceae bacterium]